MDELEVIKKLSHRHLVKYIGSYTDKDYIAYLMFPVADWDLRKYLTRPKATDEASRMNIQDFYGCLAGAINYIHKQRVRHADITSRNILIKGDRVYLSDFGAARDFSTTGKSTTQHNVPFNIDYVAPEVVRQEERNTKSDMWSLGVVFLEITTVLLGRKLKSFWKHMDDHATNKRHPRSIQANLPAANLWLGKIMSRYAGDSEVNEPIAWVKILLEENQSYRPSSKQLMSHIHSTPSFQRFCCLKCQEDFDKGDYEYDDELEQTPLRPRKERSGTDQLQADAAALLGEKMLPPRPMDEGKMAKIRSWMGSVEDGQGTTFSSSLSQNMPDFAANLAASPPDYDSEYSFISQSSSSRHFDDDEISIDTDGSQHSSRNRSRVEDSDCPYKIRNDTNSSDEDDMQQGSSSPDCIYNIISESSSESDFSNSQSDKSEKLAQYLRDNPSSDLATLAEAPESPLTAPEEAMDSGDSNAEFDVKNEVGPECAETTELAVVLHISSGIASPALVAIDMQVPVSTATEPEETNQEVLSAIPSASEDGLKIATDKSNTVDLEQPSECSQVPDPRSCKVLSQSPTNNSASGIRPDTADTSAPVLALTEDAVSIFDCPGFPSSDLPGQPVESPEPQAPLPCIVWQIEGNQGSEMEVKDHSLHKSAQTPQLMDLEQSVDIKEPSALSDSVEVPEPAAEPSHLLEDTVGHLINNASGHQEDSEAMHELHLEGGVQCQEPTEVSITATVKTRSKNQEPTDVSTEPAIEAHSVDDAKTVKWIEETDEGETSANAPQPTNPEVESPEPVQIEVSNERAASMNTSQLIMVEIITERVDCDATGADKAKAEPALDLQENRPVAKEDGGAQDTLKAPEVPEVKIRKKKRPALKKTQESTRRPSVILADGIGIVAGPQGPQVCHSASMNRHISC